MSRYLYLSRPPAYGHQPDGFAERVSFGAQKPVELPTLPGDEPRRRSGWGTVSYDEPLSPEIVWQWDLLPLAPAEYARYILWHYERDGGNPLSWTGLTDPLLQASWEVGDIEALAVLLLRQAGEIHEVEDVAWSRRPGQTGYDADCPACLRRRSHTDAEHEQALRRVRDNSRGDW